MNTIIGMIAGIVLGLAIAGLGGGGSVFLVPLFHIGFKQPISQAAANSLLVVFSASLAALIRHALAKRIVWFSGLSVGSAAAIGVFLGSQIHHRVPSWFVVLFLIVVLLFSAGVLLQKKTDSLSKPEVQDRAWFKASLGGLLVGGISGFTGVGGGFMYVPLFYRGLALTMPQAVGTSVFLLMSSSLVGVFNYWRHGDLHFDTAGTVAIGAVIGALLGAPLAGRLPERYLRWSLAILIIIVAFIMGFKLIEML